MSTTAATRSRSRSSSIRRPSLLLTVAVYHPRLPLGRIWLPVPSLPLYALLVLTGGLVCCLPEAALARLTKGVRLKSVPLGLAVIRLAGALLCSGGYTLCDVAVPAERVRVRVRAI